MYSELGQTQEIEWGGEQSEAPMGFPCKGFPFHLGEEGERQESIESL